jgi:hypothetical protein
VRTPGNAGDLPLGVSNTTMKSMHSVRVQVVRWSDDAWPGRVEVHLRESDGTVATLIDKAPVFAVGGKLAPGVEVPAEIRVACDVLDHSVDGASDRVAVVQLRYDLEDQTGRTTFRVNESQIVPSP